VSCAQLAPPGRSAQLLVGLGIVVPAAAGLDVYLYGAVTVGFDDGGPATVVTIDQPGRRPPDRRHWTHG
jgi:hypothetical protein